MTEEAPEKKVTILPEWRGDCDEPEAQVIQPHWWARRVSGFED